MSITASSATVRRRKSTLSDVPLSVESIRRRVMNVIQSVEKETSTFVDRYSGNVGTPSNWPHYIETACTSTNSQTPYSAMTDYKDLEPVLHRVKGSSELTKFLEYDELRRMVERAKLFDYIAFSLRNDLVNVFDNQLERYCLSFHQEARGEPLKSVGDYQAVINDCREQGRKKLEYIDTVLDKVDKYKKSLPKYINKYPKVVTSMEETCKAMVEACEPLKRWVTADAKYARKLQEEISRYNRRKLDLGDIVKLLEDQRDEYRQKVRKTSNRVASIESLLRELKDEKGYFKRREMDIEQSKVKTGAELARKRRDLAEVRNNIKSRQENSPSVYNYLVGMSEAIRSECRVLEEKMNHMDEQIKSLRTDQAKVQRRVDVLLSDMEGAQRANDTAVRKLNEHEEKIRLVRDDIGRQNQRVDLLKEIREVKLHSDTVKKLHRRSYNAEMILEQQDEMHTAFVAAAEDIGKDWTWLYQQLPFDPPRDFRERERDLEMIDTKHWRLDTGYTLLAVKALEKWYRQSSEASVEQLIQTLKKLKRYKTVDKIYRQLGIRQSASRPVSRALSAKRATTVP